MKNKKFLATAVAATATVTALAPMAMAASYFEDVSGHYVDPVNFLVENDITIGVSDTHFGTYNSIKRVDAAIFVAKMLGLDPEGEYMDSGFTDVNSRGKWAVDALYELDIISGKTATTFAPDAPITRNETARILAGAAGLPIDEETKVTQFKDVNSNFAKYVQALVDAGITVGKTDSEFGAYDKVTRGELAIFLYRAADYFSTFQLTVMHTNDTHSYVERAPYYATAINEVRAESENSILLDAGDTFSGDLYFQLFKGQATLEIMNHLGYDAMTFGNHEFDLGGSEEGHKALADFVKGAGFPMVAANVDFTEDALFTGLQEFDYTADYENGKIYNGVVLDVNGERVGVFGLTTEETPTIASVGSVAFSNYIEEAEKSVAAFHEMGVNKVIALTHLGFEDSATFDNDKLLAQHVEGIDVIIGGHTHVTVQPPFLAEYHDAPTVIAQASEYGKALGVVDVLFDYYGDVVAYGGEVINTDPQGYPTATTLAADVETQAIVNKYKPEVDAFKSEPTGATSEVTLDGERADVRTKETNLGNLITDGMLATAKEFNPETTIAVQNSGGIRTSINTGDITYGDVLTVMPFGNALGIVELTGSEVMEMLEHSVANAPSASGAFLQVAGMKFTYDSSLPSGSRVTSVQVDMDGTYVPLVTTDTYFVATNTFTMKGGDGYSMLNAAYEDGRASEPGVVDYEMFIEYIQGLGTVTADVEGRIVDTALLP